MSETELDRARNRREILVPEIVRQLLVEKQDNEIHIKIFASKPFRASDLGGMTVRLELRTKQSVQFLMGCIENLPAASACATMFIFRLRLDPSQDISSFKILPGINAFPAKNAQFRVGATWRTFKNEYDVHFCNPELAKLLRATK
jgi:hypothetical protein